jgi:hypothetical protein
MAKKEEVVWWMEYSETGNPGSWSTRVQIHYGQEKLLEQEEKNIKNNPYFRVRKAVLV